VEEVKAAWQEALNSIMFWAVPEMLHKVGKKKAGQVYCLQWRVF
jgi:hypothetical protein